MKTRVLCFGGLGFVGSHLVDALVDCDCHVGVVDDLRNAAIDPRDTHAHKLWRLDVRRFNSGEKWDYIFHLASPVGTVNLRPESDIAWEIVNATRSILWLAQARQTRLVYFSTSEIYAYRGETDIRAQYALGKLTSEAMCLGQSAAKAQVIRPFSIVGPRQKASLGFVLPRFIEAVKTKKPLQVFGDGAQRRAFVHVSDVVSFCLRLMNGWPEQNQVWDVTNPRNTVSIHDLAQRIITKHPGMIEFRDGARALGNPCWRESAERSGDANDGSAIGWEPQVTLDEIIDEVLGIGQAMATTS